VRLAGCVSGRGGARGSAVLAFLGLVLACAVQRSMRTVHAASKGASTDVTWRQVAPIVYANCTSCHHEGGSGPFPLMTYEQVKRRGGLVETAMTSRYMPPWLLAPGPVHFAGDRRLSERDVAVIRAWVHAGMPEGDGPVPEPPVYKSEWQLGTPDLVLEMPQAMEVPASGTDLFENFALPLPIDGTKWVRAMEIKPGSPQVTHHANVIIDRTASVRRTHPSDWQRGIPGMDLLVDSGDRFDPDSHFLFWKPDSTALVEAEGMPWRLDPGNDLVLNMHLKPTGKPESVRAKIGLYFTDKPASAQPMLLQLENDAAIDIPAGDKDFVIEDFLKLPVAVEVLGIYPHAHYLGKRMEGWVTLPTGERRELFLIKDWDIDRQSVYRLAEPLALPKGSVVHMRYHYDNSAENARNPNSPPLRVRAGNRSADEMGHLWLQVLPRAEAGEPDARMALERAWMENRLRKSPQDELALYNLGSLLMEESKPQQAAELYRKVLVQEPGSGRAMTALGSALELGGDEAGAAAEFREAVAKDTENTAAAYDLAALELRQGEFTAAERGFREVLSQNPKDIGARLGLGRALAGDGNLQEARAEIEGVLRQSPEDAGALVELAEIEVQQGNGAAAEPLLLHAIQVKDDAEAERTLALVYAGEGETEKALERLEVWAKLAPKDVDAHRALAQVLAQLTRLSEALLEEKIVVKLQPDSAGDWNDLGVMEARAGDKVAARREFDRALKIEPGNRAAVENLKRL